MSSIGNSHSTAATVNPAAAAPAADRCAITCFTGFLGAGKTTIILKLLQQLQAAEHKTSNNSAANDNKNNTAAAGSIVWLKNEFGNVAVDSVLAQQSNIAAVQEILNGCICCTAVGKLSEAITEVVTEFHPARIFVETSGSAFPAPIAMEIRRLTDSGVPVKLDAIICVIDCVNFKGYEDTSFTAKLQTKYTDLILLNKHELLSDSRQLDNVIDSVCELNPETPRIKTDQGYVNVNLCIGMDSAGTLYQHEQLDIPASSEHFEQEVRILDLHITLPLFLNRRNFESWLQSLPTDTFYRVKGFINFTCDSVHCHCHSAHSQMGCSQHSHTHTEHSSNHTSTNTQPPHHTHAQISQQHYCSGCTDIISNHRYIINWAFGRLECVPFPSAVLTQQCDTWKQHRQQHHQHAQNGTAGDYSTADGSCCHTSAASLDSPLDIRFSFMGDPQVSRYTQDIKRTFSLVEAPTDHYSICVL